MELEKLIKEINSAGWFINNLSQLDAYSWRASLRSENLMFLQADSDTAEGALKRALANTAEPGFSLLDKRFPFGGKHLGLEDLGL
jgi:hypothetical protein